MIFERAVRIALVLCILFLLYAGVRKAQGETQLNVVTGRAETVAEGDNITRLNPVTGEASVQPVDADVEINVVTGKAEWDSGHNPEGGE